MKITEQQKSIISATVPLIVQHGEAVTVRFYQNLLKEEPALQNLFSHSGQVTSHQAQALAYSLLAYAQNINDLTPILPVVEKINQKHASVGITQDQYAVVGEGVLRAFREILGVDVFTDQVREAWLAAYNDLAALMSGREERIYQEHESKAGGWRSWRKVRLVRKVKESEDVTSFYLYPVEGGRLPTFQPGQYISVKVDVPALNCQQIRQYSLSDISPLKQDTIVPGIIDDKFQAGPSYYRITVKRDAWVDIGDVSETVRSGLVSNVMHDLIHENDIFDISHPSGEFFISEIEIEALQPVVLMSAGVGLTPMMSILKTLLKDIDRPISWIHGARNSRTDPFAIDISQMQKHHPSLRKIVYHSHPDRIEVQQRDYDVHGRLNIQDCDQTFRNQNLFIDNKTTMYFICGPETFMTDVGRGLESLGIEKERVKMELFSVGPVPI